MHPHSPSPRAMRRRLLWALVLNGSLIAAEFVAGVLIRSVGLMTDAWHNLVDQGALFLTLWAHELGARPATHARTYGWQRVGILAALMNSLLLMGVVVGLAIMAVRRLMAPSQIPGGWVGVLALLSFAANMAIAWLLERGAKEDLNIRGAFWHMFGDAWVSFGVAVSGFVIYYTHWFVLDPIMSLVVVAAIFKGAWPVFRDAVEVLMETAPTDVSVVQVVRVIEASAAVKNVHDVHLWMLKPGLTFLTCHVLVPEDSRSAELLKTIRSRLVSECNIQHMTLQLETQCCHPEALHCDLGSLAEVHLDQSATLS